jgi:hypothetical protein
MNLTTFLLLRAKRDNVKTGNPCGFGGGQAL